MAIAVVGNVPPAGELVVVVVVVVVEDETGGVVDVVVVWVVDVAGVVDVVDAFVPQPAITRTIVSREAEMNIRDLVFILLSPSLISAENSLIPEMAHANTAKYSSTASPTGQSAKKEGRLASPLQSG